MLRPRVLVRSFVLLALAWLPSSLGAEEPAVSVFPEQIVLTPEANRQQLLVTGQANGKPRDVTRDATYASEAETVIRVDADGLATAVGDGETMLVVTHGDQTRRIPVRVEGMARPRRVDFERDIIPIFTRFSCNAGACHGKARGQNGFQLSLLGFDPQFDYEALLFESRGRRVFAVSPTESLLLQKPTGGAPHGGGKRLSADGEEYRLLLDWLASGAPRAQPETPALERISVLPDARSLGFDDRQQIVVTAHYSDGSVQDVTALSAFQSSESGIATVDERGLVAVGRIVGETAVMARFRGLIAVSTISVPLAEPVPSRIYEELPRHNFIDELVWNKLETLNLTPSDPADDATFLRRVYLDLIGRMPTVDEARAFLAETASDRREQLIDRLLEHPEYAEHWANKWADLLRPNPYRVGIKATFNYDAWIRDAFRKNKPYDQFVRELITAQGSTFRHGATTLFRDRRSPDELTTIVSQLFLGIRLECAKCHHHPFEVYGQEDFYSFAAYFAKVGRKGTGLSPPISGSEEYVFAATKGSVEHPLTGETLSPKPLFGTAPEVAEGSDPRRALAEWITARDNPYFARTMVNRVWTDLMGRGFVEPVDDLRATNPPSNEALLDALARDFAESGFDVKHLLRRITNSYAYSLSALPNDHNAIDTRNFSRHYRERLRAEALLDSAIAITGVPESFSAMPPDSRAREIWTHRINSLFLDAFGRPDPNQDPPCERTASTSIVQTLHLMNANDLFAKVTSDKGRAAKLAASESTSEQIIEDLYLSCYARRPTAEELATALAYFNQPNVERRTATEDLMWALMNTPEFLFKN